MVSLGRLLATPGALTAFERNPTVGVAEYVRASLQAVFAGSSRFAMSFAFSPLSRCIAYRRVIAAVAWRIPTCTRASDAPASTSHCA